MWLLMFRHGNVVIVEASSLVHALAVAAQFGLDYFPAQNWRVAAW